MLSCQECERYLPVFLDHALGVKESLDVEAHLQVCSPCADRAEIERRLRTFVHENLDTTPVPDEVKHTMLLRAMQTERQRGWLESLPRTVRLRDFTMGMVMTALLVSVVYGTFPTLPDNDVQRFAREASLAYGTYTSQHMPMEVVSADDSAVTQWINTRMGYPLKMPCITDTATHLIGGRLCRLWDRKSAALMYQRHGVPILVFAFRDDHISLPTQKGGKTMQVRHISGRPVAVWQRDGVVYSMVGDLHRDDLELVASTVNYR